MLYQEPWETGGGAWLIADMSLNIWALSIAKWLDAGYPATQVVFVRASVGLILILPLIWIRRADFRHIEDLRIHLFRVGLSAITLTASFFAISRVPLALFTAINFTRPIVTMIMAALILGETIGRRRWVAAGVAFLGVLLTANPRELPWTIGLAALTLVVFTGSAAAGWSVINALRRQTTVRVIKGISLVSGRRGLILPSLQSSTVVVAQGTRWSRSKGIGSPERRLMP